VSGHPTGGAVDIILVDKQKSDLDFGSSLYDLSSPLCHYFALGITKVAKQNRQLLRTIMMSVGFAPFDGEWWHFSYGDKEWAYYYKKPYAIYDQVDLSIISESKKS
jgi:D-alanyl-D-alanine dipeptidase